MNLFRIQTSAWDEEDFFLVTNLTDEQIESVIEPMVSAEREASEETDDVIPNEAYCKELQKAFPDAVVVMYNVDDEPTLEF
ncbi:MAG: hypothetical protein ACK5DE_14050 [Bacteroidota bacterium]|jgi:hypothetical protein